MQSLMAKVPNIAAFLAGALGTALLTMFLMVLYTGEGYGPWEKPPVDPVYTDF